MSMNIEKLQDLITKIEQWATDKEIYSKSNATKQLEKTSEEVNELIDDLSKVIIISDAVADSIADTYITLVNYCKFKQINLLDLTIPKIVKLNKSDQKSSKVICKELKKKLKQLLEANENSSNTTLAFCIEELLVLLNQARHIINRPFEDCVEQAYNVISKRKGQMIDGKFVKEN